MWLLGGGTDTEGAAVQTAVVGDGDSGALGDASVALEGLCAG